MSIQPFRRIITSHNSGDTDGSQVTVLASDVPLEPLLGGSAAMSPLYATVGLPATNAHTLTPDAVQAALALATPGIVTPGGVNARVTELAAHASVGMHRTNSVDYNVFLAGSGWLLTPQGGAGGDGALLRTPFKAGEIVIQTGTIHGWEAGPDGARWCTVVVAAQPVEAGGDKLPEVDF